MWPLAMTGTQVTTVYLHKTCPRPSQPTFSIDGRGVQEVVPTPKSYWQLMAAGVGVGLFFRGVDADRLSVSGGWPHTHARVDSARTLSTGISV